MKAASVLGYPGEITATAGLATISFKRELFQPLYIANSKNTEFAQLHQMLFTVDDSQIKNPLSTSFEGPVSAIEEPGNRGRRNGPVEIRPLDRNLFSLRKHEALVCEQSDLS
jgi:hypothetical protein